MCVCVCVSSTCPVQIVERFRCAKTQHFPLPTSKLTLPSILLKAGLMQIITPLAWELKFEHENLSTINCSSDGNFNIMHLNIRSMSKHIDELKCLLHDLYENDVTIHIVLLCETFLNNNSEKLVHINGYREFFLNRPSIGGGIAILLHNSVTYKQTIEEHMSNEIECLAIDCEYQHKAYSVAEVYRVPNTPPTAFMEYLKLLNGKSKNLIIGTDQNIDYLSINRYPPSDKLFELTMSMSLIPSVTLPTRCCHTTTTLIDNIYFRLKKDTNVKTSVLIDNMSDHYPCFLSLECKVVSESVKYYNYRKLNEKGFNAVNHSLLQTDWSMLYSNSDVNECYNFLITTIMCEIDREMPLKTEQISTGNHFKAPWMCVKLDKYNRKCKKLFVQQKSNPTTENIKRYQEYNRTLKRLKR